MCIRDRECDVSLYFRSALHLAAWLGNATAHRQRYGALAALPAPGADDDDRCV